MLIYPMLLVLGGCQTTKTLEEHPQTYTPYKGTTEAGEKFVNSFSEYDFYGEQNLHLADLFFCAAADTVLLPYGLVNAARSSNAE